MSTVVNVNINNDFESLNDVDLRNAPDGSIPVKVGARWTAMPLPAPVPGPQGTPGKDGAVGLTGPAGQAGKDGWAPSLKPVVTGGPDDTVVSWLRNTLQALVDLGLIDVA
jgi:hypothetical protein